MSHSYEFAASFSQWEEECAAVNHKLTDLEARHKSMNPKAYKEDKKILLHELSTLLNKKFFGSNTRNMPTSFVDMAHANLMTVLTPQSQLKNPVKNDEPINGDKSCRGFPSLIEDKNCGFEKNGLKNWKEWLLPDDNLASLDLLPKGSCLLKIEVKLESPFFSQDDRFFYPADNVLKRHHVFLTPYLAAAGLKGLLHWAWEMSGGDSDKEAELFGLAAEKKGDDSAQGLLYLWPLYWEGKTGIALINPQSRTTGCGTVPVKYEVVKAGATGSIYLLLVNRGNKAPALLAPLVKAVRHLLKYGSLSAKGTTGWGQVSLISARLAVKGILSTAQKDKVEAVKKEQENSRKADQDKVSRWNGLIEKGELIGFDQQKFGKNTCMKLLAITAFSYKKKYGSSEKAYEEIKKQRAWVEDLKADTAAAETPDDTPDSALFKTEWLKSSSDFDDFEKTVAAALLEMKSWSKK